MPRPVAEESLFMGAECPSEVMVGLVLVPRQVKVEGMVGGRDGPQRRPDPRHVLFYATLEKPRRTYSYILASPDVRK